MKSRRPLILFLLAASSFVPLGNSIERQPSSVYRARRVALAAKLHGGVAVLFAAEEAQIDLMPYRQDEDFYYLTGWNEPGAALLLVAEPEKEAAGSALPPRRASIRKSCFCPRATCARRNTPASSSMRPLPTWRRPSALTR